jgi:flagellar hook-basal body complex protein FliE
MALSNMNVYDTEIYTTTIELLGQKLEAFNAASGGTITLDTNAWRGNYTKESFYQQLAGAQRRVNRNQANAGVSSTALAMGETGGVKVAGGFGPITFEPAQMTWLQQSPQEAIMVISEGFADALLADQLNTAVGCAVAAVENQAALVNDVSAETAGAGALTQKVLNNSHFKFGDMSGMLRADIMHSAGNRNLINNALDNGERLFVSSNVTVVSILGKLLVVSDIPALFVAGTPNKVKVLSVVVGGVVCDNASDIITNMETTNGNERIETTWQADYTFGVKLKGYKWDEANGGSSPSDAALFTGTNWDLAMADVKHTLGTLAIADADQ